MSVSSTARPTAEGFEMNDNLRGDDNSVTPCCGLCYAQPCSCRLSNSTSSAMDMSLPFSSSTFLTACMTVV